MKKILIALTIAISSLGISSVKAENLQLTISNDYEAYKSVIGEENLNNILDEVLEEYKNTYMSAYPYYIVQYNFYTPSSLGFTNNGYFDIKLFYSSEIPISYWQVGVSPSVGISSLALKLKNYAGVIARQYHVYEDDNYIFDLAYVVSPYDYFSSIISMNSNSNPKYYEYYPSNYYLSNFELYMSPLNSVKKTNSSGFIFDYDNILIPKLDDSSLSTVVSFDREDYLIEPYYLYDTDVNVNVPNMTEINLNDYAYVALALKDYQQDPFETTVHVKGNYCLTPVYNYGMTERKDILTGSQVERCSPYYENYTPVRTYITESDLKNNSIYYLKAYDTSKNNYVKVDTSIFDITYITEENKENPYVTIGGKTYPTIPFCELTDTAIKSEDEGYVSGASKEFSFSDIFTAPLEFLKDIWDSIASVFDLVKEFFSLLPEPIPTFLLSSFLLGLAIGLLKLIF